MIAYQPLMLPKNNKYLKT